MYHCHIHFYLAGSPCRVFDIIKETTPLEYFTHDFSESEKPEDQLALQADMILVSHFRRSRA